MGVIYISGSWGLSPQDPYGVSLLRKMSEQQTEVILPEQPQTKSLVYVLVKKEEAGSNLRIRGPRPTSSPAKPEVYFIRYKSGANGADVGNNGDGSNGGFGGSGSSGGYSGGSSGSSTGPAYGAP